MHVRRYEECDPRKATASMARVTSDFLRDLDEGTYRILVGAGHSIPATLSRERLLFAQMNLGRRRISRRPRPVHRSRQLLARSPGREHSDALDRIEKACVRGDDLLAFQSTTMLDARYRDALFDDWGIQHLHLDLPTGKKAKDPRFVRRAKELLFVLVRDSAVYFIDLLEHGDSFLNDDLIEVLHTNWPKAIRPWLLAGIRPPRVRPTREERIATQRDVRTHGVGTPTFVADGTGYCSIGGGYATDNTSIRDVSQADNLVQEIRELEESARENADLIAAQIQRMTGRRLAELKIELRVTGEPGRMEIGVVEATTGKEIHWR